MADQRGRSRRSRVETIDESKRVASRGIRGMPALGEPEVQGQSLCTRPTVARSRQTPGRGGQSKLLLDAEQGHERPG